MPHRKKSDPGGLALLLVGGVVAALAAIPKELWIVLGMICGVAAICWLIAKAGKSDRPPAKEDREAPTVSFDLPPRRSTPQPVRSTLKGQSISARWIAPGESIEVAGRVIPRGMLYFGSDLKARTGDVDPALIEPRQPLARDVQDPGLRQMDYWPSYSTISSSARRAYIDWLASGRSNPQADVGYVFLFFYGLERRALVDAATDASAKADLPLIATEVRRLLDIYGQSRSFRRYATTFLDYLAAQLAPSGVDAGAPPPVDEGMGFSLKAGLGRLAAADRAVPVDWAFSWAQCDERISFPKALQRCPTEFAKLFAERYGAQYKEGIRLPVNKTKLRMTYRPASSGFGGTEFEFATDSIPDITAVVAPAKKIERIVEECAAALAPYSRYVGKNPGREESLEAILLLPRLLWPSAAAAAMQAIDGRIGDGLRVLSLGELADSLGGAQSLTRDRVRALAHALEELHIAIEPDILAGSRTPKADDRIILFRAEPEDAALRTAAVYQSASVSLDLACSVAMADGQAHPNELRLLMKQIDGWAQLSEPQRKRLRARLRMAIDSPPSLASLRGKLEVIPAAGRRAIAHLLSTLAQADGNVSTAEVKLLEKIYRALDLDVQTAYSDLHQVAAPQSTLPTSAGSQSPKANEGLALDMARIEALQRETEQVSALLSKVFADDSPLPVERQEELEETSTIAQPGPLGLDPEHSIFLRLLVTRSSWPRQELADAAADMELMLDGALERINEAAFDQFDEALIEGDDPIEVARDLLEKLPA